MQKQLKQTDNILTKRYDKAFCVVDTGCLEQANADKLYHNYRMLQAASQRICIIPQNKNFEDELRYILGTKNLNAVLHLPSGHQNLKRNLSTYNYTPVITCFPDAYCNHIGWFVNKMLEFLPAFPKGAIKPGQILKR